MLLSRCSLRHWGQTPVARSFQKVYTKPRAETGLPGKPGPL